MPTNNMTIPPARIAKASTPTTKSNPAVFSIKLNRSPIKYKSVLVQGLVLANKGEDSEKNSFQLIRKKAY